MIQATSVLRGGGRDAELVGRLVERARAAGLLLTGDGGLLQQLTKRVIEAALDGEITDHLGYDKGDSAVNNGQNSRNGARGKSVLTEVGPVEVDAPHDHVDPAKLVVRPFEGQWRDLWPGSNSSNVVDEVELKLSPVTLAERRWLVHVADCETVAIGGSRLTWPIYVWPRGLWPPVTGRSAHSALSLLTGAPWRQRYLSPRGERQNATRNGSSGLG